MRRYLVFTGYDYYPSGGWDDFRDAYTTLEDARAAHNDRDWKQIVDTFTMEVVV